MLIYKDFGQRVNLRSENINSFDINPAAKNATIEGAAKGAVGPNQVSAFKVYAEDKNGPGSDFFEIRLCDKNNNRIYHAQGPLTAVNLSVLSGGY